YTNVTAHGNLVRPVWTRLQSNQLSIWTALVQPDSIATALRPEPQPSFFTLDEPAPNPFSTETGIAFKLHRRALVNLSLVDLQGREVARLTENEWLNYGKYLHKIEPEKLSLRPGAYFVVLTVDGKVEKKKLILAD